MILVIIIHIIYFRRIQLGTRILIFVCFSVAIFQVCYILYSDTIQLSSLLPFLPPLSLSLSSFSHQVILLIDMVLAPTVSTSGCIALGVLLQFAVIAQFVWMFMLVSCETIITLYVAS